jgi:hypothetical protein
MKFKQKMKILNELDQIYKTKKRPIHNMVIASANKDFKFYVKVLENARKQNRGN